MPLLRPAFSQAGRKAPSRPSLVRSMLAIFIDTARIRSTYHQPPPDRCYSIHTACITSTYRQSPSATFPTRYTGYSWDVVTCTPIAHLSPAGFLPPDIAAL